MKIINEEYPTFVGLETCIYIKNKEKKNKLLKYIEKYEKDNDVLITHVKLRNGKIEMMKK